MRKPMVRSSGAIAVLATVAACSTATGSSSGAGAKSLTWYVNKTPTLTSAVYDRVASGFEQSHPGVHVTIIDQGGQDLATYFRTLMSTGNAPDVGDGITASPQNDSQFVDLSTEPWAKALAASNSTVKSYMVDGGIYTVPVGYQVQSVAFYNKQLFQRAGITAAPTTFDELEADLPKLKSLGVTPMATAGQWVAGAQLPMLVAPSIFESSPTWEADRTAGKVSFKSSPWSFALAKYSDWIQKGYLRKDAMGLTYDTVNADFLNGKYAIYLMGSFLTADIDKAAPKFGVGVFQVPSQTGNAHPSVLTNGAFQWEIPKTSHHQALAKQFVQYLATDTTAIKTLVQADGDFDNSVSYPPNSLAAQIGSLAKSASGTGTFGVGSNLEPDGFSATLYQDVQGLWTGKSAQVVAGELDSWWSQNAKKN